ncbi:MAG: transposase [Betaproteobacteria bacterium]|nr:transposase [Betaproteobacteria bacterium]
MPSPLRRSIPGHALHVIRRGRGRALCFFDDNDRLAWLGWLAADAASAGCAVHAYVLMANHVHLLLTPARPGAVEKLMESLAARHLRYVVDVHDRHDPVWEARYDSWPVHRRPYLLACMRYIETNPVRAALVRRPEDYRWSSFRANAWGQPDPAVREQTFLRPHAFYYALGRTPEQRRSAYLDSFERPVQPRVHRIISPANDDQQSLRARRLPLP